jgi:CheY-like chemotaxis protein
VESELGQGSVFSFELPLRPAIEEAPAVALPGTLLAVPPPAPPEAAAPRRSQGNSRGRVLLAEDGEANQLVAAAILRKAGFSVDLVCDGAEAVAAARSASYDVVLMDVRMPGLDGYAATAMIRALEGQAGEVPILALTASAMPGDAERCLAAGMDAHLAKPVDRAALVGAVAALMERKPRRPRAAEPPAEPGPGHALLGRATLEELRAAVGPGRLPDLVGIFAGETLARLRRLATRPPLPLVEEEAHALQSAAGTFGAAKLREAATALESAAAQGHGAAVEAMLAALPPLVERTLEALSRAVGMPADSAD